MKKLFLIAVLGLFLLSAFFLPAFAESNEELTKALQEKQAEIAKLEAQLENVKGNERTLKSQLNIIDSQGKVTTLKIEETNLRIEKLKREISELSTRISRISASLDTLSEILLRRITQTYKYSQLSTLDLFFSSHGFSDLLQRLKYVQVAQAYEKRKLYELQATKQAYNDQKQDKATRQEEAEQLNKALENYKNQLAEQKKAKEELLSVTKNDEAKFQGLIAQLKADADSIARAVSNVGVVIGPVKKGQQVGSEGTSGCSSGPHLHFEVYENAKVENGKVTGTRVDPKKYLDNGQLGTPMQGYPGSTHISTEYGEVYALGTHTGLDMYDDRYVGTPILAAADGVAYSIGDSGCRVSGFDNGPAKGVVVDHQNGLVTLYWHLL